MSNGLPDLQPVNIQPLDVGKTMMTVAALKEAQAKNAMTQNTLLQQQSLNSAVSQMDPTQGLGQSPNVIKGMLAGGEGGARAMNALSLMDYRKTQEQTKNQALQVQALSRGAQLLAPIHDEPDDQKASQMYQSARQEYTAEFPQFANRIPPTFDRGFVNQTIDSAIPVLDKWKQQQLLNKPDIQLQQTPNGVVAVDKNAIAKQMKTGQSGAAGQVAGLPKIPPFSPQQNADGTFSWKPNAAAASGTPTPGGAVPTAPSASGAPPSVSQSGNTAQLGPTIAAAAAQNAANASATPSAAPPVTAARPVTAPAIPTNAQTAPVTAARPVTAPAIPTNAQTAPATPPMGNPAIMPLGITPLAKTNAQSTQDYEGLVRQDFLSKKGLAPALTPEQQASIYAYEKNQSNSGVTRTETLGDVRQQQVLDTQNENAPTFRTVNEIKADPGRYLPIGEGSKALNKTALIEDLRGSIQNVRDTIKNMPDFSTPQSAQIALAMRNKDPGSALSTFFGSEVGKTLSAPQQDYLIHLAQLQEVGMSLRTVLGVGQGSEDMRRAFSATIPGASTPTKEYAAKQLNALEDVLNRVSRGIPKVNLPPGVPQIGTQPTATPASAPAATPQSPLEAELMRRGYKNVNGQWVK